MASIVIYTHDKFVPNPDGLCPKCHLPSLKKYILTRIDLNGLTPVGERVACRDEAIWVTDFLPYDKEKTK